jgi:membrane associated rhomboid family serine protease
MIPIRDNLEAREKPLVTWTLIGLNVFLFYWDRNWAWGGHSIVFADLAMRPSEVIAAITGNGDPFELGKLFTSMFLHGSLWHLIGNMLFLLVFGENVERALGGFRFAIYYLFWGIVAAAAHIFVHSSSPIQTLGASGAIGGVLGCYFLLFPGNRVQVVVPPLIFFVFALPAWVLLAFWFVFQVLVPQAGVANWAHAGGFLAGMITVLVAGGRAKVLRDTEFQKVLLEEDDE